MRFSVGRSTENGRRKPPPGPARVWVTSIATLRIFFPSYPATGLQREPRDHHIHLTKSHPAMRWHRCQQFQEASESGHTDGCRARGVEGGERFDPKCFLLLTVEHWEFYEPQFIRQQSIKWEQQFLKSWPLNMCARTHQSATVPRLGFLTRSCLFQKYHSLSWPSSFVCLNCN